MIKRLILSLIAFIMILFLVLWLLPVERYFPGLFGGGKSVLILYDEPDPSQVDEDMLDALMLRQLTGHFEAYQTDLVSTGEYKQGRVKKYQIVFYVGNKADVAIPTYLLDDLFFFDGTVVWLGGNLNQMARRHSMDSYGFQLADDSDNHSTNRVVYKEKSLWKLDTRTYAIDVTNQKRASVHAWATVEVDRQVPAKKPLYGPEVIHAGAPVPAADDEGLFTELPPLPEKLNFDVTPFGQSASAEPPVATDPSIRLPWIVHGKRLWYIASNPFSYQVEGGAYLAFCDILHEVFGSKVEEDHPAMVRIEDVHAKRDPADLLAAADYLQSKNIPFIFTLIPVYVNPETNETIYISHDQEFQETVRGLIARGGVPILHGYTHQNTDETAVDYEFWNGPDGGPLATGPEFAGERVLRGLSECFLVDVFPLAWTTPHYAASQVDYASLRNYFTTVVERRQPIDRLGSDQFFPYPIFSDMHQQIIFPESLGYVQPQAGRDAPAILKDAQNTLVVRDGWGSFFFHTFLDIQLLKDVVEGLEKLGYHWVSLAEYNNKVSAGDTVIVSGTGEVKLELKSQYLHEITVEENGEYSDETYSYRPITGIVEKYSTNRPGVTKVYQGVYTSPPLTLSNLGKFRPVISGITSPVAIFLLLVGTMIMLTFLVIWIFLLVRKASGELRSSLNKKAK